ncbi:MAG: hypothetical protein ABIH09_00425 [Candidatus Omnitrophota bacterium]
MKINLFRQLFLKFIVFLVLSIFSINTVAQACPCASTLNVQTFFKPLDPENINHIRDKGIIKYYLYCLAKTYKNLNAVPGDMKTSIGKENIRVALTFSPEKRLQFAHLLKDQKNECIIPSSIDGITYYAYVTAGAKSKNPDITVFTESAFKNKIKDNVISHENVTKQEEIMIEHEEKIDTPLCVVHGIEGKARDIPSELKESLISFFTHFGAGEAFLKRCEKFIDESRVKIVPYSTYQNVSIGGTKQQIQIKIDTAHASDNYINIPVENTDTYVPVMKMLVRELAKKCDRPYFFNQTLANIFEEWHQKVNTVNLCKKYPKMHEVVKKMQFRNLAKQKGVRRSWPEIYKGGKWIECYVGGISSKKLALLDGVTIKKQLSPKGTLVLGRKDLFSFQNYADRFVEVDMKNGWVTKVRIYKKDPREGIENTNPEENFDKEIVFSQLVHGENGQEEKVVCSWYSALNKNKCDKIFSQYSNLILKARLTDNAALYLSRIKPFHFCQRLANREIEAEIENGDVVLVRYVEQKDGHIYKTRIPSISGVRKKLFKKEQEFKDKLSEALTQEGLEKQQSELMSAMLVKMYGKFFDILEHYKLITAKTREAIGELDILKIDISCLASQLRHNGKRYKELGYSKEVTKQVGSTTGVDLAVLPVGFIEYLATKYRLRHPSKRLLGALRTYNPEAYIRQYREALTRQGTFDEQKHLKLFNPEQTKELSVRQRKILCDRFREYSRILDTLSKNERKEVTYTDMHKVSGEYEIVCGKSPGNVKSEEPFISSDAIKTEIREGDTICFYQNMKCNFTVKSVRSLIDGPMIIKIKPEQQKSFEIFSKQGSFIHVPCDNIYSVQRKVLRTMINTLVATEFKTTGIHVADRLLRLKVERPCTEKSKKTKIKFYDNEIPWQKVNGQDEDSSGWVGDESHEMAVKYILADGNVSLVHASVGTNDERVIAETIMQYAKKGKKKVLFLNSGKCPDKKSKVLEKVKDKGFPVFGIQDECDGEARGSLVVADIEGLVKSETEIFSSYKKFDVIIMAQSSLITLTETFVPLAHLRDEGKLVLFGDSNYLAPFSLAEQMRLSEQCEGLDSRHISSFFRSVFDLVEKNGIANEVHLSTSWQLLPEFSLLVSSVFNKDKTYSRGWDSKGGDRYGTGFRVVDISSETDECLEHDDSESGTNVKSAIETVKLIKHYLKQRIPLQKIMIITLTDVQKEFLKAILKDEYTEGEMPSVINLKDYRGEENQVVIFDFGTIEGVDCLLKELYAAFVHATNGIGLVCNVSMFSKETEKEGQGKRVLRKILGHYIKKMWEYYPEQLSLEMMNFLPKQGLIRRVYPGLLGKYQPLEDITFIYDSQLSKYVAKFWAIDIEGDNPEKIVLYAKKMVNDTFEWYQTTGIPEIDRILRETLLGISEQQRLILEYNRYNIDGIGTKNCVALARHLNQNGIAKFHEIAHAAIDKQLQESSGEKSVLLDYIIDELVYQGKTGKEALDIYLEKKCKQHNVSYELKEPWKKGWKVHYALKLFQEQKWPDQNKILTYLEKFYTGVLTDGDRRFNPIMIHFPQKGYENDYYTKNIRNFLESRMNVNEDDSVNAVIFQNLKCNEQVNIPEIVRMIQEKFFERKAKTQTIRTTLERAIRKAITYGNGNKKNNILVIRWYYTADGIQFDVIYPGRNQLGLSSVYNISSIRDSSQWLVGQSIHLFLPWEDNPEEFEMNKGTEDEQTSKRINSIVDAAKGTIKSLKNVLFNLTINCGDDRILVALDTNLGQTGTDRFIKEVIEAIGCLNDPTGKIIIITGEGKRLAKRVSDYIAYGEKGVKIKEQNVVMVTKPSNNENCKDFQDAIITFVDDSKINFMEYYPLPEVVLFTVAKALHYKSPETYTKRQLVALYKTFNSEIKAEYAIISICINQKRVTIILEPTVPFDYDKDLVDLYKKIETFL